MSIHKPLRVRHFATSVAGGAGVAARRLHSEMSRHGIESCLHHRFGFSNANGVRIDQRFQRGFWRLWQEYVIGRRWRQQSDSRGIFLHARWIYHSRLREFGALPDIVNLHVLFRWLDLPSFLGSIPSGLPVVWSLHDMHVATGGCIHPLECTAYTSHCQNCPSLKRAGRHDRSWREFKLKDRLYSRLNLHVVGNSEWTTAQARGSALMQHAKSICTIPLGIDTEVFKPLDKHCARQVLGIANDRFVIGFACADFTDPNKGGKLLVEALHSLANGPQITLLAYGAGRMPHDGNSWQAMELGPLTSPSLQALFYSACDVFAAPSRIESFGLTALEAMACGTPVVAFATGGMMNLVADGETGLLEKDVGSVFGFCEKLRWLLRHPAERLEMGHMARWRAQEQFPISLMTKRYIELYKELLPDQSSAATRHTLNSVL